MMTELTCLSVSSKLSYMFSPVLSLSWFELKPNSGGFGLEKEVSEGLKGASLSLLPYSQS